MTLAAPERGDWAPGNGRPAELNQAHALALLIRAINEGFYNHKAYTHAHFHAACRLHSVRRLRVVCVCLRRWR